LSLKTKIVDLSVIWPQNHCDGFLRFGLKTGGVVLSVVWFQNHLDDFLRFGIKTSDDDFSRFNFKTGCGFGFLGLGLKTDSYCLVIWASKLLRQFLSLDFKAMWAMVC
jgi:hypothetical protein